MNWDDLRIFLGVARHGTLAQAAIRLAVDPTTVARRIQRLEQALSATLFEHTPAGHLLTARGNALLVQAEAMEEAMIAAAESGAAGKGAAEGTIRISVSEGFGSGIVAPHLGDFAAAHPRIGIELVASSGFLNPSRREADIAIMLARPKSGPLIVRKLTDYHLGLYASAAAPVPATIEAALARPIIGYVPDLIYAPELRYLDDLPGKPTATITSSSINAQAQIIRSGAGLGVLPCFIGTPDPGLRRLMPGEIDIQRRLWIVVHRDMRNIARVRLFIDWLDALVTRVRPILSR
jgi:DNA-binding transcriptional LysR family regulator